ncbi:hypothetical protein K2173_010516 [Erythroxylum novogranatense]|uniref:Uncharacterized protein n=1 Tax=Erythroxylum novogranatense TaxID=1862640 RepID=A0AAV8TE16_9ROSI|nr:hypothetical protein K2173_010516 [Erythroxylum novogranatense]
MASKINFHARFNSLSSRPHPVIVKSEENISRLKQHLHHQLDVCSIINDALLHTRERTIDLISVIRRRQGGLDSDIRRYKASKKIVLKTIQKAIKTVKGKLQTKPSGWSLPSKLMHHKRVACNGEEPTVNEYSVADAVPESLTDCMTGKYNNNSMQAGNARMKRNNLDHLTIQDLEEGTDCLYRHMIETRPLFSTFSINSLKIWKAVFVNNEYTHV